MQYLGRIAPRVVAREQRTAQRLHDEAARRLEHLGLGAAKAVDALLRVADDEHARRPLAARTTAGASVRAEPGVQRVPLQRAGVLELVDEHVADARIEPLLHPAGERGITQQREAAALQVGHVGEAALALVASEFGEQQPCKPHHAQVLGVRIELVDLRGNDGERILRGPQRVDLAELLARRAAHREQCSPGGIEHR